MAKAKEKMEKVFSLLRLIFHPICTRWVNTFRKVNALCSKQCFQWLVPIVKFASRTDAADLDGLNFLAGKRVDEVNKMAELGTMLAHVDGGVPNIQIVLPKLNEYFLGQLIQFFELACGLSGYTLGVNPFDQPGVEAYKKNMFALLEKPGYEEATKAIKKRL